MTVYSKFKCFSASCQCPNCLNEYDMDAIEHQLVDAVQKRSMTYVLQDLKCKKCREVRQRFVIEG